jgi:hypothetical protein
MQDLKSLFIELMNKNEIETFLISMFHEHETYKHKYGY